jgi:hypothetical protein
MSAILHVADCCIHVELNCYYVHRGAPSVLKGRRTINRSTIAVQQRVAM